MTETISNYDRLLGELHGLPDVTHTKPSTVRSVTQFLGMAHASTFIVQTYRQKEIGDTIFLECVDEEGTKRIPIPPAVADTIARQREALTSKTRSKAAKIAAQDRKDRGELPGFMRKKGGKS